MASATTELPGYFPLLEVYVLLVYNLLHIVTNFIWGVDKFIWLLCYNI